MDHSKDRKENHAHYEEMIISNFTVEVVTFNEKVQKQWPKPWQTDGSTPIEYHLEYIVIWANHLTNK